MTSDWIALTCPHCGGTPEAAAQRGHFACSHCGREQILNQGENLEEMAARLSQMQAQIGALQRQQEANLLPVLAVEVEGLSRQLQGQNRVLFSSLVVFFIGFVIRQILIFPPEAGLWRFFAPAVMWVGAGVFLYTTYSAIRLNRARSQRLRRMTEIRRRLG